MRGDLPLHLLSACLSDAVALGYRRLAISGGEPLLYDPLAALLAQARALEMTTTLTTNGLPISPERWEELAPLLDDVTISVDGPPREHDAIRRREGALANTVANFKVVRESGVPFELVFTLTRHNVDSLGYVARLAAHHGARAVQVQPLRLHGRAITTLLGERPDRDTLASAVTKASDHAREFGIPVQVHAVPVPLLREHRGHFVPAAPIADISAAVPLLFVEADASVIPLTYQMGRQLGFGSLVDANLALLARRWLDAGSGAILAQVCARTWAALTEVPSDGAVCWHDEIAARVPGA